MAHFTDDNTAGYSAAERRTLRMKTLAAAGIIAAAVASSALAQSAGDLFREMRPAPTSWETENAAQKFSLCLAAGTWVNKATSASDRILWAMERCDRVWQELLQTYDPPLSDIEERELLANFAASENLALMRRLGRRYEP